MVRFSTTSRIWSERRDSNSGPSAPKADALPDCATLRRCVTYTMIETAATHRSGTPPKKFPTSTYICNPAASGHWSRLADPPSPAIVRRGPALTQQSVFLPKDIHQYILDNSLREPPVLARLRAETATLTHGHYQIAPEEGQLLTLVLELLRARRTLDIGTFTGYSALIAALAVPPEGKVIACDVSVEWTDVARRY